ncbi:MAG: thioredoxin family protein [Alphaproteobacteria bacterium]|nr:thioredoxin family protein [Alphaproteobacteria bacterium]
MRLLPRFAYAVFALICALSLWSGPSQAASGAWAKTEHTAMRLISQSDAVGGGPQVKLGLHFQLNDHWKIYWRTPGDAGFPPSLSWSGSENVKAVDIAWPLPERFSILGIETLGYTEETVLPLTVALETPGQPMTFTAEVSYLACAELCIPYDATLSIALPAGPGAPSDEAHLINRYQSLVPGAGDTVGLALDAVQFKADEADPDRGMLYVSATARQGFSAPDVFIEGPAPLAFAKPAVAIGEDGKMALLSVPVEGLSALKAPLTAVALTLTLADAPVGAEFTATPAPATGDMLALTDAQPKTAPAGPSLLAMLGLAVLGGLILNLMPCVLPVLSIKLLGVVSHGGAKPRTVRLSFLASAAGIIASFLVLAAALVVLKELGMAIGWGIQFQHPWFLVSMALVVTLFACNMWGFFEVALPDAVSEIGAGTAHVHGLGSHFMSGALATLLATPCSAPFLGTAVGFALARGVFEIVAIFIALGLGLAVPYLLVALYPKLATKMPRPGRWMVTLRRVLGFALAGTGAWLVVVLAAQVDHMAAAAIGGLLIAIAVILYVHKRMHHKYGRMDWGAVAVLAALAFAAPSAVGNGPAPTAGDVKLEGLWRPFDLHAIRDHVRAGQVVFVDVTAEWCITCKVNKAVVVSADAVLTRLKSPGVIAMQADWTRPDAAVTAYLASFGRYGIPFNAVYGPGAPDGIALPELLSESEVLGALDAAR